MLNKFSELQQYIKEAKGNKNALLNYGQPNELKDHKLTVDIDGTQDVNNKNAYYGQEKVNNIVEEREKDRSNFLLDNDKEYEREPQDNINGNKRNTNKANIIPKLNTKSNSNENSL